MAPFPGPFLCQPDIPFLKKVGAQGLGSVPRNGRCPVVTGSHPPRERGTNHTYGLSLGSGYSSPSQQPPFPVFKLCAFDHLILKIFYAKSSRAPEVKDRGTDTLASGTLSSPCSAPLQFRLGEQKQEWQLFPLPGHMPSLWIASEPPSRPGGRWTPSLLSASWPGPLTPGVCIYMLFTPPLLCCMHVIFYSQSVALPPVSSVLPPCARGVGDD